MTPRPCWILCTPRTGSSYLCELLNNTGLFPEFTDNRLSTNIGPIQKGLAFNEWLRVLDNPGDLANNTPHYCKAIYHQYIEVMSAQTKEERRSLEGIEGYKPIDPVKEQFVRSKYPLNYVKACVPGVKFVVLTRNPVAQAVSTYFARKTLKYHLYTESESKQYFDNKIPLHNEVLSVYREVKNLSNVWDDLCKNQNLMKLDYDLLVSKPGETLSEILKFLNVEFGNELIQEAVKKSNDTNKRIFKMTRPECQKFESFVRTHSKPIL